MVLRPDLDYEIAELMKKIGTMVEGEIVLKYQLIPEDLESLVSVRTDEDLRHMLEEYDRHQDTEGNPKLRTFLFPSNPVIIESQTGSIDPQAIDQRYIDAINGIVSTTCQSKLPPIKATRSIFSISSACSSPKSTSPEGIAVDSFPSDLTMKMEGYQSSRLPMHKVKSSPSLCSLGGGSVSGSGFHGGCSHHCHQLPYHFHANPQHQPQQQQQASYVHGYQVHRPPNVSLTQADFQRPPPVGHGQQPFFARSSSTSRSLLGIGSYSKYGIDEAAAYGIRRPQRAGSVPLSPKKGRVNE